MMEGYTDNYIRITTPFRKEWENEIIDWKYNASATKYIITTFQKLHSKQFVFDTKKLLAFVVAMVQEKPIY
jgi:hypothetical protein